MTVSPFHRIHVLGERQQMSLPLRMENVCTCVCVCASMQVYVHGTYMNTFVHLLSYIHTHFFVDNFCFLEWFRNRAQLAAC